MLYYLDSNSIWNVHQHMQTKGAIDAEFFHSGSATYLAIANNRDNAGNFQQSVHVYVYNRATGQFEMVQNIPTIDVQTVDTVSYEQTGTLGWRLCEYCLLVYTAYFLLA